ncbi:MAG: calcium-binding protein [Alphaproteobacteria bacterium]
MVSVEDSTVYWDIDEDGFAEATGWVAPDDGLLAIDTNGDGIITDHTELFGDTIDGFTVLSAYDTNGDNVIDANDAQFTELLIWKDVNQNGFSEADELYSLADFNIVSIDLNASTHSNRYIEGNRISHSSTYTVDDGASGAQTFEIVDAWFTYDDVNTNFVGDYTLDLASLFVTTLRGYGNLPDLHVAASIDNDTTDPDSLMSLLQDFTLTNFDDLFTDDASIMDQVQGILFRWAGVDGVDPSSRGVVDGRKVEFLEELFASEYRDTGKDPVLMAAQQVNRTFDTALYPIVGILMAQGAGAALFNDGVYYNPATDTFEGFTHFKQDALDDLLAKSLDGHQVDDKTAFWMNIVNMIDASVGVENLDATSLAALETALFASDNSLSVQDLVDRIAMDIASNLDWADTGEYRTGTNGIDIRDGTIGDDTYHSARGDDILNGHIGNDHLTSTNGEDILNGGLGDDTLSGGVANDSYLYFSGHGNDTITDTGGTTDKIVFGDGISFSDISFVRVGSSKLIIQISPNAGAGSILINNVFNSPVEILEFADGSTVALADQSYTYIGTDDGETIYGTKVGAGSNGIDTIYGGGGDDIIYGKTASSTSSVAENYLYGGDGNDIIKGDKASDTAYGDAGDDILSGHNGHDFLHGGDGIDTLNGQNGNDILWGDAGDDILDGGLGNDILYGGAGADTLTGDKNADTFVFESVNAFDAVDTITDFKTSQNDKLDVSDLLSGYDPVTDAISDFVQITDSGSDSIVSVDVDGGADNFVQIATLNNVTGLTDEDALLTSGNLIAA